MKVKHTGEIKYTFGDLKNGEVFGDCKYMNVYIKIFPICSDDNILYNAVNLETGRTIHVSDNEEICLMPNTFLDVRD